MRYNRKYRLVNPLRFIISSIIILILVMTLIGLVYNIITGLKVCYNFITEFNKPKEIVTEMPMTYTYSFSIGDEIIQTNDEKLYITLLENRLLEYQNKPSVPEEKKMEVYMKKILKNDYDIYTKYKYALVFGSSDVTINDLKMILKYCEKYNVNPHLWLNLIELESAYISMASGYGSDGWGQIIESTAKWLYEDELKLGKYDHATMSKDKEINSHLSIYYLSKLIKDYDGNINMALIRYNGGAIGQYYPNLISSKLRKNSGLTFEQVKSFN